MSESAQPPNSGGQASTQTGSTTVARTRSVRRRRSGIGTFVELVIDLVIFAIFLVLLNWPALRDGIFAVTLQTGGAHGPVTTKPLLDRGFLNAVLPWLDGAIVFALVVRTLARFTAKSVLTLLLGLVARLAGAAVIVYMLLQRVIFSAPSGVPAPFGGGTLQAFAEFWGRAVLVVALALTGIGVLAQMWALARWRRS